VKTLIARWLKFLTVEFIVAIVVFMLAVFLFAVIANELVLENETAFDTRVFKAVSSYASPAVTSVALFVTFLGSGYFLIPVYLFIISWFIKRRNNYYAIMVAVVALVSMLSGFILKGIFHRARPLLPLVKDVSGYSFPSGHSLAGFTFSGLMIYITWRSTLPIYLKWIVSIFLCMFALLIGLSRIYLHVHFASDVIGSFFVTIAWLSVCFIIFRIIAGKAQPLRRGDAKVR
jgi:undecaprenyl-diphosphatase